MVVVCVSIWFITRYNPQRAAEGEMMDYHTIADEILRVPLIGIIPESNAVLEASNQGQPVIHFTDSAAGQCYEDIVSRFWVKMCHCVT